MKKILIVCGNGIASSSIMLASLKDYLDKEGLQADLEKASLMDCTTEKFNSKDLIVSSTALDDPGVTTPVIVGVGLLTGIDEEKTLEQVKEAIQE
ncbi:MAG: PTS sugar transporter subunit IIB [Olsenella profusa]